MKYIITNKITGSEQTYSSKETIHNEFNVSKLKITEAIKTNSELTMPKKNRKTASIKQSDVVKLGEQKLKSLLKLIVHLI